MKEMEKGREETSRKIGMGYVPFVGWMAAIFYLITDKDKTVRWNAMQSLLAHAVLAGVYFVALPLMRATIVLAPVAWILGGLLGVVFLVSMLVFVVQAYEGKPVKIPVISDWTDRIVK